MEWLLKIVEGPMKGAEIALIEGLAVSFGSNDTCDIVVHDTTVPAKACEFEVDATGVRIAVGGGSSEILPSFEIHSFGTTSFAVGPADGEWQELVKPMRPQITRADADETSLHRNDAADKDGPQPQQQASVTEEMTAESSPTSFRRLIVALSSIVLLAALLILVWFFWPRIIQCCPMAETARITCVEQVRGWFSSDVPSKKTRPVTPKLSLAEIAATYHLKYTLQPQHKLIGNLQRRTERLAIRALALAADSSVKFDLTDDETLFTAASELIFACSDGALKVDAATNRLVTLSGYAPSAVALERAIRALNADVKGIEKVDATRIKVGGAAPSSVAKTPFVREQLPGEHAVVAIPAHTPNPPMAKQPERDIPIAGILTSPYPCVVMRNGLRLVEGAQIGKGVLLKKIESDKLVLTNDGREIIWKP